MTLIEQKFQSAVRATGCVVCRIYLGKESPAEIHHMLRGGRRISHFDVLPLCRLHHRGGGNGHDYTSRHPWRKAFILKYGSEEFLYQSVMKELGK